MFAFELELEGRKSPIQDASDNIAQESTAQWKRAKYSNLSTLGVNQPKGIVYDTYDDIVLSQTAPMARKVRWASQWV